MSENSKNPSGSKTNESNQTTKKKHYKVRRLPGKKFYEFYECEENEVYKPPEDPTPNPMDYFKVDLLSDCLDDEERLEALQAVNNNVANKSTQNQAPKTVVERSQSQPQKVQYIIVQNQPQKVKEGIVQNQPQKQLVRRIRKQPQKVQRTGNQAQKVIVQKIENQEQEVVVKTVQNQSVQSAATSSNNDNIPVVEDDIIYISDDEPEKAQDLIGYNEMLQEISSTNNISDNNNDINIAAQKTANPPDAKTISEQPETLPQFPATSCEISQPVSSTDLIYITSSELEKLLGPVTNESIVLHYELSQPLQPLTNNSTQSSVNNQNQMITVDDYKPIANIINDDAFQTYFDALGTDLLFDASLVGSDKLLYKDCDGNNEDTSLVGSDELLCRDFADVNEDTSLDNNENPANNEPEPTSTSALDNEDTLSYIFSDSDSDSENLSFPDFTICEICFKKLTDEEFEYSVLWAYTFRCRMCRYLFE